MAKNKALAQLCKIQNDLPEIGFSAEDLEKVMYVTISSGYIQAVADKKVSPKKGKISKFTKNSVVFEDGT